MLYNKFLKLIIKDMDRLVKGTEEVYKTSKFPYLLNPRIAGRTRKTHDTGTQPRSWVEIWEPKGRRVFACWGSFLEIARRGGGWKQGNKKNLWSRSPVSRSNSSPPRL